MVMTVPMCDMPNTIVGATLVDFLALGCRQGYFTLEQLIYQYDAQIAALDSQALDEEADENEILLLQTITTGFSLQPWDDHAGRFRSLEDKYFQFIKAKLEPD